MSVLQMVVMYMVKALITNGIRQQKMIVKYRI